MFLFSDLRLKHWHADSFKHQLKIRTVSPLHMLTARSIMIAVMNAMFMIMTTLLGLALVGVQVVVGRSCLGGLDRSGDCAGANKASQTPQACTIGLFRRWLTRSHRSARRQALASGEGSAHRCVGSGVYVLAASDMLYSSSYERV